MRATRGKGLGAWLGCLLLLGCAPVQVSASRGTVVQVLDGDSLRVMPEGGGPELEVRLHGIDAPERGQPFADRARSELGRLALGRKVELEIKDVDRYGRRVCRVRTGEGISLNEEMVRLGLAWWSKKYAPDDERLRLLQQAARASRMGLWTQSDPLPPWAYRARRRGE